MAREAAFHFGRVVTSTLSAVKNLLDREYRGVDTAGVESQGDAAEVEGARALSLEDMITKKTWDHEAFLKIFF